MYDYKKYWEKRGKNYKQKFQYSNGFALQEYQLLKALLDLQFKSVFEVGCGFGRITKIIQDNFNVSKYDAIDISKDQIKNANIPNVNFEVADFMTYQPKEKYDLVIASELFLHIPPNMIESAIEKFLGMSNKYAINIDVYGHVKKMAEHNFIHPYFHFYRNYDFKAYDLNNGQFMFVIKL